MCCSKDKIHLFALFLYTLNRGQPFDSITLTQHLDSAVIKRHHFLSQWHFISLPLCAVTPYLRTETQHLASLSTCYEGGKGFKCFVAGAAHEERTAPGAETVTLPRWGCTKLTCPVVFVWWPSAVEHAAPGARKGVLCWYTKSCIVRFFVIYIQAF